MTDPFDVLRLPATPLAPDPAFAARLRARLATALDATPGGPTMPTQTDPAATTATDAVAAVPGRRPALSPYLVVADGHAALAWYEAVFGGVRGESVEMPDGRLGHAELIVSGSVLMLADEFPEMGLLAPGARGGTTVSLVLDVADVDATAALAVEQGATVEREPADMPYGFRAAAVVDPFGHRWLIEAPLATEAGAAAPTPTAASGDRPGPRARTAREVTDDHEVYTEPGDIVYVTWMVEDEERAAAFYGELLGWTFTAGSVEHALRMDGSNLLGGLWGRQAEGRNEAKLMYHVPDIVEAVAKVRALGGTATDPELMPYGWSADCTDDQGMEFWIYTPAEP
jgi:uncharacterized glyoxalase superfamily protein PhnB